MICVNGRFLRARPTGLHRTGRSLLSAAIGRGLEAEVLAPSRTDDPLVTRIVPALGGRLGDHLWEQIALPVATRGQRVLSLANTAPLAAGRSVVTVHDLAPLVGPEWFARSMGLYGRLVLAGARRAAMVCTVSVEVAGELSARGVDDGRIRVVPPAVDRSFRPADAAMQRHVHDRLGLDRPFVLFVGWADPRKDLSTAVAAHRRARETVDHLLVLVGREHPAFAPVDPPGDPTVVRAGYVSDDELLGLYTSAAALVYPSRYEGFGLPPLEAWACGTPAIVSDLPVLRESTRGGAVYVSPGDVTGWSEAIRAALAGELTAPEPPRWTWDDAAERLLAALDEVA